MPLLTGEEADARDRAAARTRPMPEGYMQCPGYPLDHYCLTMIPWTKRLCTFCEGTRLIEQRRLALGSTAIPSVGEILAELPQADPVEACPCGGDLNAAYHEASLLHLGWVARQRG